MSQPFPSLLSPITNDTGNLTPPWMRFFQSLFSRVGGGSGEPLLSSFNLSDVGDAGLSRSNLGLGAAALAGTTGTVDSSANLPTALAVKTYADAAAAGVAGVWASFTGKTVPAAGATLTVAHGLGAVPRLFKASLVNGTSEGNWATGDAPGVTAGMVWADATNLYFVAPSGGTQTLNKTTGAAFTITPANWTLSFSALK